MGCYPDNDLVLDDHRKRGYPVTKGGTHQTCKKYGTKTQNQQRISFMDVQERAKSPQGAGFENKWAQLSENFSFGGWSTLMAREKGISQAHGGCSDSLWGRIVQRKWKKKKSGEAKHGVLMIKLIKWSLNCDLWNSVHKSSVSIHFSLTWDEFGSIWGLDKTESCFKVVPRLEKCVPMGALPFLTHACAEIFLLILLPEGGWSPKQPQPPTSKPEICYHEWSTK